jgi:chromosome segregation ATPase
MSSVVSGVSVDEFQALEQKVLRAVEVVKREREARAAAEAEVVSLRKQLADLEEASRGQLVAAKSEASAAASQLESAQREKEAIDGQLATLVHERDAVRQRIEQMMNQIDELL